MPDFPTLEMAKKMVRNFRDDDFTLWIVRGVPGLGMSAYSIKNAQKSIREMAKRDDSI